MEKSAHNELEELMIKEIAQAFKKYPDLKDPTGFPLASIVDGMIMGIAARPELEEYIPLLQKAMDILRLKDPSVNVSAHDTVMTMRAFVMGPNSAPIITKLAKEDSKDFADRVIKSLHPSEDDSETLQ